MSQFLKFKKSNCKNCYKCIRNCPVKSIRFSGNQANIIDNECILCGQCFVVCPQNAKEIVNDVSKAKVLLAENEKVIVSMAPSFIANYNGTPIKALRKALKQLGFYDVEETAVGATIVKNRYEKILKDNKPNILISSCCHSVNLLIQKYFPNLLCYLADVVSPMQAHCINIKQRYPNAKTVFIGPCLAKKDEADHYKGITDVVLTFEELTNWLKEENISIDKDITEDIQESKARLFPTTGGILKTMQCDMPEYTYIAVDGVENCINALNDIENGEINNCFIEMSACTGSCIGGPIMEKYRRSHLRGYSIVNFYAGKSDFNVSSIDDISLKKHFESIEKKNPMPSQEEISAILKQMGKNSEDDELNCSSCGYNTCREKAIAIYQGKADLTMCLPYLKDKAESFSDNIINNSPNGIVVLNEKLEVQQINKAAMEIMKIRDKGDVLGEQVIRILDTKIFLDVMKSGRIDCQKEYLAEYNRYVEQTVVFDRKYRVLICILRDVSNEETQRKKKETISNQTVDIADKVVEKQMRVVQEIASLLGETAAETKIALTKLKESITDE